MALFRRFFYRKPPDRLLEISERVYVFDCCFSTDVLDEDEYRTYMNGIVAQLQDHYPDAAFMVFNFKEGERRSQLSDVLSQYDMTVMDYPRQYEGCPLLPLEMIHHFLRSSESWLSLVGQQNVLLMHCERGGWPVLAFMLAGLLLYRKQYTGEQKTLEMVYKQAPKELLHLLSPLNPQPSQLRYLQYISRRNIGSEWPPSDSPLALDCIILRILPVYDGGKGCRPVIRVYGQDPSLKTSSRSSKLLFSSSKVKKHVRLYKQEECELVKIDIHCRIQGDIVLECIHLEDDLMREEMVFRVMFHTAFVRSNVLMLTCDEVDVLWDAKDQFSREFRVEVIFSDADSVPSIISSETESEDGNETEGASPEEFFEAEEIFSSAIDGHDAKVELDNQTVLPTSQDDNHHPEVRSEEDLDHYPEIRLVEDVDHHAFEDCASDEGIHRHIRKAEEPNDDLLQNGDHVQLDSRSVSFGVTINEETKSLNANKFDEWENKQNEEAPSVTKKSEKQGQLQKLVDNKQKLDKGLSLVPKKQPVSTPKSSMDAVATNKKSKQQETQVAGRLAKANSVSRWIPTNKGSHTNSMHVYYPPSRHNSAPAALSLGKDSLPGGKSKPQSVNASSEATTTVDRTASGRAKHVSCPSALDLSPAQESPSTNFPLMLQVEQESLDLSHSILPPPSPQSSPPPPPPPPPSSKSFSFDLSSPPITFLLDKQFNSSLPKSISIPPPPPPPPPPPSSASSRSPPPPPVPPPPPSLLSSHSANTAKSLSLISSPAQPPP